MDYLLTSSGFTTKEIAQELKNLVNKEYEDISIAIVCEAHSVEEGDKSWIINELNNMRKYFPGYIDIIDLLALDRNQIVARTSLCDVIYVLGGNTDYQMKVFNDSDFGDILQNELSKKVYVGSSAGSMVICKRVSTKAYIDIYGEALDFNITKYLELTDFAIKPHLDSEDFPNNRKEKLKEATKTFDGKVFCIRDDQAIVIKNDEIIFVGGEIFTC